MEDRLREALGEAGATVEVGTLRPLMVPDRRRFGVNMRLGLVGAAAVVVAGAATVVGFTVSGAGEEVSVASARAQAPDPADVSVFLCTGLEEGKQACQGRAATEQQTKALAESLGRLPGVAKVFFEDRRTAYERFRKAVADRPDIVARVKADDVPASYRITLEPGARPEPVSAAAKTLPGVAMVSDRTMTDAAAAVPNKVDISVFLCVGSSDLPSCESYEASRKTSKRGKGITAEDTDALEREIKAMPGVQKVTFEDQQQAYKRFKKAYAGNKTLLTAVKVTDMPLSFRVRLKAGTDSAKVAATLRTRPGVSQVVEQKCSLALFRLMADHGISRTFTDVCN
ncbi:permease-like cell division protein FtsX [Nonomuraea roseoviolacea]|uniref:permease-like cell division protein FtsX n=1 Tax=Nonomuraea roseoviolacea TaxID=103837 RepID=UPI0020A49D80|nr:permease-like cell division protein FtsX [Nonomuraea roseoviolacea]